MKRRIAAGILAGALALSLSACSGDSADSSSKASASASASASDGETEAPEVVVSSEGMPTIKDGDIPQIEFPKGDAPEGIHVSVVEEGKGAEISRSDWISANYVGAVWGEKEPFDSSYSRKSPMTVSLSQLVTGWGWGLEGRHVGDKLVVSIPPEYGYGEDGQPSAGIGGEDTIVFYIELLNAWSMNAAGEADAAVETSPDSLPVEIVGEVGQPVASVKVKEGAAEPTERQATVIARGTGAELKKDDVFFYQVAQSYWDNSLNANTWTTDEAEGAGIQRGQVNDSSVLAALEGVPVGSRVLLLIPGTDNSEASPVPPVAAVIDVIDIPPSL